jgi:hypothetical protein
MIPLRGYSPSINELCRTYCLKSNILSILTDVPVETIEAMLMYRPVEKDDAQKVLNQLSVLLSRKCTFDTVYVPLVEG